MGCWYPSKNISPYDAALKVFWKDTQNHLRQKHPWSVTIWTTQKKTSTFHYIGWLLGIFKIVNYILHIAG